MNDNDLMADERIVATVRMPIRYYIIETFGRLIAAVLTLGLAPYLICKTSVLYVTDRRVVHQSGILERDSEDFDLRKINQVSVQQPLIGRLLGYGFLEVIENDGRGFTFGPICMPGLVRKVIQEQAYVR